MNLSYSNFSHFLFSNPLCPAFAFFYIWARVLVYISYLAWGYFTSQPKNKKSSKKYDKEIKLHVVLFPTTRLLVEVVIMQTGIFYQIQLFQYIYTQIFGLTCFWMLRICCGGLLELVWLVSAKAAAPSSSASIYVFVL